jgi:hypothetical protein
MHSLTQCMQKPGAGFSANDPFAPSNWWAEQKAAAQKNKHQVEIIVADVW